MFKSVSQTAVLAVVVVSLSACGPHDEKYYQSHPEALENKLKECEKLNMEQLQTDQECKSAILAAQENSLKDAYKKLNQDLNGRR